MSKTTSLRGLGLIALAGSLMNPAWAQLQQTFPDLVGGANPGSLFGTSVSLSSDGKTAVVGAPGYNPGSNANGGSVWAFTRSASGWDAGGTRLALGTGGANGSGQGTAVAISGDGKTVAVGGPNQPGGGVWFYTGSGESFSQQGPPFSAVPQLGASVALSSDGNTAIAGAPGSNQARVYVRSSGGSWSQQAFLTAGSVALGASVALSADGNTALVGDPSFNASTGQVLVFTRSGTTWSSGTALPLGTPAVSGGRQGLSVGLSAAGTRAIVGGFNANSPFAGGAWIFTLSNGTWAQEANPANLSGQALGNSVAISGDGNHALVGGPQYSSGTGVFHAYDRSVNPSSQVVSWNQSQAIAGIAGYQLGFSVAIDGIGTNALVAAP